MEIGLNNTLTILRTTSVGLYLGDEKGNDVLLPNKYVPENYQIGDAINVFLYRDSEDRIIATTLEPKIRRNEFAWLKVREVSRYGAFLDWGLEKDLLVPFNQQKKKMEEGRWYLVFMFLDAETDRLVASAKYDLYLEKDNIQVEEGDEVELLIGEPTVLGYNVIINNMYGGLLYHSDLFKEIVPGQKYPGFIKHIRPDKKIDVTLGKKGFAAIEENAQRILDRLKLNNGFLALTDNSDPAEIKAQLEMSKKTFKKAVGTLYKEKLITLDPGGVYLVKKD